MGFNELKYCQRYSHYAVEGIEAVISKQQLPTLSNIIHYLRREHNIEAKGTLLLIEYLLKEQTIFKVGSSLAKKKTWWYYPRLSNLPISDYVMDKHMNIFSKVVAESMRKNPKFLETGVPIDLIALNITQDFNFTKEALADALDIEVKAGNLVKLPSGNYVIPFDLSRKERPPISCNNKGVDSSTDNGDEDEGDQSDCSPKKDDPGSSSGGLILPQKRGRALAKKYDPAEYVFPSVKKKYGRRNKTNETFQNSDLSNFQTNECTDRVKPIVLKKRSGERSLTTETDESMNDDSICEYEVVSAPKNLKSVELPGVDKSVEVLVTDPSLSSNQGTNNTDSNSKAVTSSSHKSFLSGNLEITIVKTTKPGQKKEAVVKPKVVPMQNADTYSSENDSWDSSSNESPEKVSVRCDLCRNLENCVYKLRICGGCSVKAHYSCIKREVHYVPHTGWFCLICRTYKCTECKNGPSRNLPVFKCAKCDEGYHSSCHPEEIKVARGERWKCVKCSRKLSGSNLEVVRVYSGWAAKRKREETYGEESKEDSNSILNLFKKDCLKDTRKKLKLDAGATVKVDSLEITKVTPPGASETSDSMPELKTIETKAVDPCKKVLTKKESKSKATSKFVVCPIKNDDESSKGDVKKSINPITTFGWFSEDPKTLSSTVSHSDSDTKKNSEATVTSDNGVNDTKAANGDVSMSPSSHVPAGTLDTSNARTKSSSSVPESSLKTKPESSDVDSATPAPLVVDAESESSKQDNEGQQTADSLSTTLNNDSSVDTLIVKEPTITSHTESATTVTIKVEDPETESNVDSTIPTLTEASIEPYGESMSDEPAQDEKECTESESTVTADVTENLSIDGDKIKQEVSDVENNPDETSEASSITLTPSRPIKLEENDFEAHKDDSKAEIPDGKRDQSPDPESQQNNEANDSLITFSQSSTENGESINYSDNADMVDLAEGQCPTAGTGLLNPEVTISIVPAKEDKTVVHEDKNPPLSTISVIPCETSVKNVSPNIEEDKSTTDNEKSAGDDKPYIPYDSKAWSKMHNPYKLYPIDEDIPDATSWSSDEVFKYFSKYFEPDIANIFKEQDIDGVSLLLMTKPDIIQGLGFKLGTGLKVLYHVKMLQLRRKDLTLLWTSTK